MKRILLAAFAVLTMQGGGWAQSVQESLIAALKDQGYVILEEGYTFLGRLRIVAENGTIHRELVVNPGTGEVLRDYAVLLAEMNPSNLAEAESKRKSRPASVAATAPVVTTPATTAAPTVVASSNSVPSAAAPGPVMVEMATSDGGMLSSSLEGEATTMGTFEPTSATEGVSIVVGGPIITLTPSKK